MPADYCVFDRFLMMIEQQRADSKIKCQFHQPIRNNALYMLFTGVHAVFNSPVFFHVGRQSG